MIRNVQLVVLGIVTCALSKGFRERHEFTGNECRFALFSVLSACCCSSIFRDNCKAVASRERVPRLIHTTNRSDFSVSFFRLVLDYRL